MTKVTSMHQGPKYIAAVALLVLMPISPHIKEIKETLPISIEKSQKKKKQYLGIKSF